MNWDRIEGNWTRFKRPAKTRWGKLTDGDLDAIAGRRDQLADKIRAAYGISAATAERQVAQWLSFQKTDGLEEEKGPVNSA